MSSSTGTPSRSIRCTQESERGDEAVIEDGMEGFTRDRNLEKIGLHARSLGL
ncbi:MAG: hypothetical protein ACRDU9_04260 [Acidimicrobiia bacterium]